MKETICRFKKIRKGVYENQGGRNIKMNDRNYINRLSLSQGHNFYFPANTHKEACKPLLFSNLNLMTMRAFVFCFLVAFLNSLANIRAQTIQIKNPSFEDVPSVSTSPTCWIDCGFPGETPPDIQPDSTFKVNKYPLHGNTYLGMVTRDTETWEAVGQMLETPLLDGECYNFHVYLARSESYLSNTRDDTIKVQFTEPARLRIWGGNSYCDKKELLSETKLIEHTEWRGYWLKLKPNSNYSFIMLEAFYNSSNTIPYNGNLLIDNCFIASCNTIFQPQYAVPTCEINTSSFNKKHVDFEYIYKAVENTMNNYYWHSGSLKDVVDELDKVGYSHIIFREGYRIEYLNALNKRIDRCYSFSVNYKEEGVIEKAINLLINTKGIALDYSISLRNLIQKIDDAELISLEKKLRRINNNISNVEMLSLTERINSFIEISPMYEYRDSVISKIQENQKLKESIDRTFIEWQEVQNKLEINEISIDFVKFNDQIKSIPTYQYYAALISKNSPTPQFIRLDSEKTISQLLQIGDNGQPKYLQDMPNRKELHEKIWQPLLTHLDLEGITTIHISPAGSLHRVSFEALQDEKGQYLNEQFQFHYYSSMRDFVKKKPTNHSYKDAVLMGDILYDLEDTLQYRTEEWYAMRGGERGKVKRLEATLDEIIGIHKACDNVGVESNVLTYNQATEDTIQYFSGEHAPSILHLATHGLYLEPIDVSKTGGTTEERMRSLSNPLQRAVLMLYGANHRWEKNEPVIGTDEDGILTALEITALDLRKTDLVVLSACSTALGEFKYNTEGVFGLQRAFKLAGVDYVVASLWDVDDEATKDLMVEFYKNLLERKQDPATALRNAKKYLREDEDMQYGDPEDWAGFILIE